MLIHVAKDGRQSGPYSVAQVQDMVRGGLLSATDLGWHAGMAEWAPLHAIPELGLPPAANGIPATVAGGPPGDRFKRLVATCIDGLLIGAATALAFGMGFLSGAPFHWGLGVVSGLGFMALAWLALLVWQCYLLATRGQSLGKIAMGLRIVRVEDGGNPGFVKAVVIRTFLWGLVTAIPVLGGLAWLVGVLFIFRDDQRCVHDHLAGTRVVPA